VVKIGVSFYYVGDIDRASDLYSRLLGIKPVYTDGDWVRFHLEGGDIAFHLDPGLRTATAAEPSSSVLLCPSPLKISWLSLTRPEA
jgi:hypothetical protein